jgi:hypothetical protein
VPYQALRRTRCARRFGKALGAGAKRQAQWGTVTSKVPILCGRASTLAGVPAMCFMYPW